MTFPSHFHMPGSFHDGVHPGLFRPPVSPSSSTDYLSSSAYATESGTKRKWSRRAVPRVHETSIGDGLFDGGDAFMDSTPLSRPVSRAYALAGQLDTPTTGPGLDDTDTDVMGESMFSDSDYRRALGSKRSRDEMDTSPVVGGPTPLFNPMKPVTQPRGWGSFAFATIGGVVGRVWDFCKIGSFKGFYAGGGTSFTMTSTGSVADSKPVAHANPDGTFYYTTEKQPIADYFDSAQNVPGQFPSSQNFEGAHDDSPYDSGASTPTGPATKRRHTDFNELGRHWVMIQEDSGDARRTPRRSSISNRPPSRTRKQPASVADRQMATPSSRPASVMSNSTPRRPASRTASRPGSRMSDVSALRPARPASAASFASFSGNKSPTPSRIPVHAASTASVASPSSVSSYSQPRRRRNSAAPPPSSSEPPVRRSHRRTNSAASPASNRGNDIENSPRLDAEAKHLATRRKMEERDADVRMAAFNKRLQDMIRQGKEALGTTVEVDVNEGGWEDDI